MVGVYIQCNCRTSSIEVTPSAAFIKPSAVRLRPVKLTLTEENFAWHIHDTIQTDALAGWIFVVDNLNTHCSETLVRYVARLEGIDEVTLGKKGRRGVLKSMASRHSFLSEESQ